MEPIVSLVTLSRLLSALAELAYDMKDARDACTRVYTRLKDILEELHTLEHLPAQDKLAKYVQVLQRFADFLESYRAKPLVWRLVKNAAMMDELKMFHEEIDALVVLLQLSTTRLLVNWKQQWQEDAELQMQMLLLLVDNSAKVLKEVESTRKQVEALTSLKYELDQRQSEQTEQMTVVMRKLFAQIVRVSNAKVPSIPPWFLPSSDVEYDATPFAQGSFGAVHHARWNSGARVVVKTLLVDNLATQSGSRSAQSRILAEIDVWFRLNHPNVIKMYGACHVSSPPFIVCELAAHGNLADFLDKSSEHQQLMWQLLYEAALGLEYLHKRKVVHGDLKLNNILVGSDGVARLADFGLSSVRSTTATARASSAMSRTSDGSTTHQGAGALRWRAPECLQGKPKFASDVYSLGMCIIEAATGEPPFATIADDIVFQLLLNDKTPGQPDELDEDAWALVEAMVKPQPAERCSLEFVIASLKKLARRTVLESNKASLFSSPRYSISSTRSTMSLSSMSEASEDFSLDASSLRQSHGTNNNETFAPKLPAPVPLDSHGFSPPPAQQDPPHPQFFDEEDLNESTSVQKLVEELRSEQPSRQKKALQWIYRRAYQTSVRTEVVALDGVRVLSAISQDASGDFYQQLYALGSLRVLVSTQEHEEMETKLRDLMTSDRNTLLDALSAAHTDDERQEAAEVVTILVYAKPRAHGLEECAVHLVDLLGSSNESLCITGIQGLAAFFADSPSATMVRLAQFRALPALAELFVSQSPRKLETAVSAIDAIVAGSPGDSQPVLASAVIAPLVTLAQSASGQLRFLSVRTLSHFAQGSESTKAKMVEFGAVSLLAELLERGVGMERATAALTLGHLALDHADRQAVVAGSGVIHALVELVRSGGHADKSAAAIALAYLAKGNDANAESIAAVGAMESLVDAVGQSTSLDHERYLALVALLHLVRSRVNALRLATPEAKNLLATTMATTSDNKQAELAAQILERLSAGDAAEEEADGKGDAVYPSAAVAATEYDGAVDARTMIDDLLRVVAFPGSDDRVMSALRWLYRHAYNKPLRATIRDNDGAVVLSELARDTHATYDHRLYACGCLWLLRLEDDTIELANLNIPEPQYADLQRLYAAMAPHNIDERRTGAIELLTCLQYAHADDHGFTDFLPRILDALRSETSERLISTAARAVAVFARQLPISGELMVECGVVPLLMDQVSSGDAFTTDAAVEALGALGSSGSETQSHVVNAGAMAPLIRLIRRGTAAQKRLAVVALGELLRGNGAAQREAAQSGAIGPLMDLLRSRDHEDVAYGASGIRSLCETGEAGAVAVVLLGAVPLLVAAIQRKPVQDATRREVALALETLSCRPSATSTLVRLGVGETMFQLSKTTSDEQLQRVALRATHNLA